MLRNIEFRLLRILLYNSTGRRRMPAIKELEIKTGRRLEDILS